MSNDKRNGCRLCESQAWEISDRGAYLARVNEKGVPGIWECRPPCDGNHGTQDAALLAALAPPSEERK